MAVRKKITPPEAFRRVGRGASMRYHARPCGGSCQPPGALNSAAPTSRYPYHPRVLRATVPPPADGVEHIVVRAGWGSAIRLSAGHSRRPLPLADCTEFLRSLPPSAGASL